MPIVRGAIRHQGPSVVLAHVQEIQFVPAFRSVLRLPYVAGPIEAARDTAADRGDSVRTEMASPRLLAPSGGAGPGVGGTGPGMTVAVTDRTTANRNALAPRRCLRRTG